METEIWPNLFRATAERQVPLVIVNARLSERSAKGYARVRSLTHESLSAASWIATQSNGDRERFLALGAEPGMVETVGNIKFDRMLPPDFEVLCNQKRAGLFGKRPVFVAGSTHRDEEALLLASARVLWEVYPNLLLVLAPRHPERFPEVADLCRSQKISIACRSETKDSPVITQVLLLDQMGELQLFYGMADIAFVGGSLIAAGGHNPLEPAAAGVPTLFGPNMFNFREISEGILACGAAIQVENAEAFTNAASQLLADARARMEMGAAGRTFVQQGRGALRRIVDRLEQWLPNDSTHNDLTI
jgi:3-deoxy-D-manno-octulosonic-acid transferase